ncbi:MAG: YwaF family protein [Clostridia bacterium]|nr:YwaF family protein [Clostridia bacterium]
MFTGNYNFFDYKLNIPGYTGQDHGGLAQYLYLAISAVLLVALLVALRKTTREKALRLIGFIGIFMTLFYIGKTSWESFYDVRLNGGFNFWLLPFDSCSLIMPAAILAGFARGKVRDVAAAWVATGGIVGGFATMLFLNAFYYYPFLSFGAFYSMLWHFLMVFMGLLVLVSTPRNLPFSLVTKGYLFHLAASAVVIPIDFIWNFDFMLYKDLGGVPFFEGVASDLTGKGLGFLNPLIMLILYFAAFSLIWLIAAGIKNRKNC